MKPYRMRAYVEYMESNYDAATMTRSELDVAQAAFFAGYDAGNGAGRETGWDEGHRALPQSKPENPYRLHARGPFFTPEDV